MRLRKKLSVFVALCIMMSFISAMLPTAAFGENEIFTINNAADWEAFAAYIANGEYTDEEWKLGADISVNVSVTTTAYASGATIGTEEHPFSGTFDGQGHTLTVNIADTYYYFDGNVQYYNQGAAPFRYISGATIKNLTVEGTIYGGYHTAGLVGFNQGGESTIENCAVNVTFSANNNIYQYIGGVLGHNTSAKITMKDVIFAGTINNSEYGGPYQGNMVGGLIGWSDSSTVVLNNCLFKGSITGKIYRFNPVLLKDRPSTVSATLSNVYYTCEPHTVWLSNGSSQNVINENVSRRVFSGIPENTLYEHFVGADGMNYNAPCTISGIRENYIAGDDLTYTVKNYFGTTLDSSYYNVNLTRNGSTANTLANDGEYTLTLTGKNGYTGTFTKSFLVYEDVPYIALDGTTKYDGSYKVIDDSTDVLANIPFINNGWYVAVGDVAINGRITVSGDVNIILCDGATLRVSNGIRVSDGNSLTIWGQVKGTGKLIANGEEYGAGIGAYSSGSDFYDCGTVTINGGIIDATGGHDGAGIGGIYGQSGGTVTVNSGTVIARGGVNGAGIGMGRLGSGGTVNINGGTVTANGGESGAGIGGGDVAGCGTIVISGGTVNAYGGSEAAAIGGGRGGNGGNITIKGGIVTAVGGEDSPGIPNDYVYDIGAKGGSTTTLTYTDDSAAEMSVKANKFVGTVKFSKVFYNADTLARYDVTDNANTNALSGTFIPAANYRVVTLGSGYNLAETYDVPVIAGGEYTLPECTFTPPSELRPFVAWVVKVGANSVELLQPGDTIAVTANTTASARFATEYGSLQTLINNAANGATITLTRDYISDHPGWDSVFTIPADKEITIDLAGHTIDRGFSSGTAGESCNVFSVYGTLTICDTSANQTGVITGGNNRSAGGAIRVETGGTLNFESGTVSGNKSTNGGAIYNIGTVNISGGLITNNTATNSGGGIFNNDAGTLNLTGGTISGNSVATTYHGGGIHTSGTLNVSGAPVVTANYRDGAVNNIGLYEGSVITVTGSITEGALLGINKSAAGTTALSAGIITSGFGGNTDVSAFSSDNGSFVVGLSASGEAILSAPLTLTFDKGNENAQGTMASVTIAPNLPYILPACSFTAPAHKYFGGWSVNAATKVVGEEIAVSADTVITAIWADTPYAISVEPSVNGTILTDKIQAIIGETVTLTPSPNTDFALETLTVMFGGDAVSTAKQGNGTYTFVMPAGSVTVNATFRTEIGTSTKPFEIHNESDWDTFAAMIEAGTYTSDYYKLADDFDNSVAITTPVGTTSQPFRGHFDGNGKTLVVNIDDTSAQGTAPFRYISGATIENLTVSGSVTGGTHASGLVGFNWSGASTINNVTVNVNVTNPATEGNLHIGGVLGHNKSAVITMTNVVFGGTISNNGSFAGGLVGWSDSSTITLTDCLFKGEYTGSGKFHPVACKNGENTVAATVTRVYYIVSGSDELGQNNATDEGLLVYTSQAPQKINIDILAADGITYYIPATVKGLYKYYENVSGAAFAPSFTVVGDDGRALEAGTDYTVAYSPNDVAAEGEYTITLTGINGHSGTYTETFTLLGAISYVDANGTAQTPVTDYTVINQGSADLPSGWYVVIGDVTVNLRLLVTGDVNIILCDGATLNATKGVRVDNGNSLTIWSQEEGTGKLIAANEYSHAAIGSVARVACGAITINGGVIDARGGNDGAGIGGGYLGSGGAIAINGGTVRAIAGDRAAAIGGGYGADSGTITINGGSVTAVGSSGGAGIGGGDNGNGGTITINAGSVNASASNGAAIGGGNKSYAGLITINGGIVTANAAGSGAAIGMGQDPSRNPVTSSVAINGGIVTATSASGSGIGHGNYPNSKTITVSIGNENPTSFVSVKANKVSGTVAIVGDLTDGTTVYHAGAVSDTSVLDGKTLTSCVSTESTYNDTESGKQLLINSYHVPNNAALIASWYDENGVMLSTDIVGEINTVATVSGSSAADHAKVFVWENLDSLRPLCDFELVDFREE